MKGVDRLLAIVGVLFSANVTVAQSSRFDELGNQSQRKIVRGCPVDMECDDSTTALKEVVFRPRNQNAPTTKSIRPQDLRPDLPWLAELQLPNIPFQWDDRIIRYLVHYKNDPRGRSIMSGWLKKQSKYRAMIEQTLARAGLPTDLQYLAMIESGFDPNTVSRVGAVGLWQFMPAGGKIYDLQQTRWVDLRRDPTLATQAASAHLRDLFARFGNWELALAAYNAGYGGVLRAIATFNSNNFWKLLEYENALPWGSSFYVAKALAAAIVGNNRELFGYDQITYDPPIHTQRIKVKKSTSLSHVARSLALPLEVITTLNPQFRHGRTPPNEGATIHVPSNVALSSSQIELIHKDEGLDTYTVKHGQRFEDIATRFGISRRRLRKLNGIRHELEVRGGDLLLVPRINKQTQADNAKQATNNLYVSGFPKNNPDEPLMIPVPDKNYRVEGSRHVFYRVVTGDSLFGIAKSLGIDRFQLASYNGLHNEARIHPRMILQAFINPNFDLKKAHVQILDPSRILVVTRGSKEHLDHIEKRVGRKRITYTVKTGDTMKSIGRKYGLSGYSVGRINRISPNSKPEAGQELILYKVVDPSRSDRAKKQSRRVPRTTKRRQRTKTK